MFKLAPIPNTHYSEVSQVSPMRWACLFLDHTEEKFLAESAWWKCKDFLNDVVVYHRLKREFPMYGFQNKVRLNLSGGYLALKSVGEAFEANLAVLNTWLVKRGFDDIGLMKKDEVEFSSGATHIILIPPAYWQNTFMISIITSLIRSCAFKPKKSVEELVKQEDTFNGYWEKVSALFVPQNVEKMNTLVFLNYQYSGLTVPDSNYTIHNAGMQSWSNSWKD